MESPWAKIKGLAGPYSFLEAPGENMLPCIFQFLQAAGIPWPWSIPSSKSAMVSGVLILLHSAFDFSVSLFHI